MHTYQAISLHDALVKGFAAADLRFAAIVRSVGPARMPVPHGAASDLAISLQRYSRVVTDLAYRSAHVGDIKAADRARDVAGVLAPVVRDHYADVLARLAERRETAADRELILTDAQRTHPSSPVAALAHDVTEPLTGYWGGLKRLGPVVNSEATAAGLVDALLGVEVAA